METVLKRLKYRLIVPTLINISHLLFKNRNENTQRLRKVEPVFIIGSGRNGSTILASILNNHPALFFPPEQYILPYAIMKWHLYRHSSWEKFSNNIINDFLDSNKTQFWNFSDLKIKQLRKTIHELRNENRNVANLIEIIFTQYYNNKSNELIYFGDQSPLTTQFIPYVINEFKESKFIFLIRDARDVILSYSKFLNNPASNPKYAAWKWNDSIKSYQWLIKHKKKQVILVKYENLVNEPDKELKRIIKFLGLDHNKSLLDYDPQKKIIEMGSIDLPHHVNLSRPINNSSIGKWKTELNKNSLEKVMPMIRKNLIHFGYLK